ncbi:MAG: malate synthase [Firmicutes bacterium]|nr:malate synthase [Bacillota bacterium]
MEGINIRGTSGEGFDQVLTPEALVFLRELHRRFNPAREQLLRHRMERQAMINTGVLPDFLPGSREIREGDWQVARIPADLQDRRVEITGPTDRKMVINALNSGAKVFMADFEDANTPTWANLIEGQLNLTAAIERRIDFESAEGKAYKLKENPAVLLVRPRGWHLPEKHLLIDDTPTAGGLFDFGLYFFHNAKRLLANDSGPYFYLPKLEGHLEARLWNDVFNFAQDYVGVPRGTIKATVLIETVLAAFEMEEILYELREHIAGLNAGRWDYIFTFAKKFQTNPDFILPERSQVTMTVPFMRAYSDLLIKTCHRRGAFAMGGMSAFIPNRRDPAVTEKALAAVRADKTREAADGCDGTWVAHPDLVPVAMECFDKVLGGRPNQVDKQRPDVSVAAKQMLDVTVPGGAVTEAGLRSNVLVSILYIESWLRGVGAAALFNLMEDAATAEISRSQVWQWVKHGAHLQEGTKITAPLVREFAAEELAKWRENIGSEVYSQGRFAEAVRLFEEVALGEEFVEFLTLPAYDLID